MPALLILKVNSAERHSGECGCLCFSEFVAARTGTTATAHLHLGVLVHCVNFRTVGSATHTDIYQEC